LPNWSVIAPGGDARPQRTSRRNPQREPGRHVAVDDFDVGNRGTEDAGQLQIASLD
jgi:hypothetical protein